MTPWKIKNISLFVTLCIALCIFLGGCGGNAYSQPSSGNESVEISKDTTTENTDYYFRNEKLLNQHYEKHGIDMGFESPESYEKAASDVINNPKSLNKEEAEDGDFVFYLEDTNEFVVLSTDGYIRTYFLPDAGKRYYDRQ